MTDLPEDAIHNIIPALLPFAMPIDELNPDLDNTVEHTPDQIGDIGRAMARHGQDQPLVVQRDGMIIRKGNGRYEAAIGLTWTHIAAIVVDESNVDAVARAISDNKVADARRWRKDRLASMLRTLSDAGEPVESAGFDSGQVANLLSRIASKRRSTNGAADSTPSTSEPEKVEPTTETVEKATETRLLTVKFDSKSIVTIRSLIAVASKELGCDEAECMMQVFELFAEARNLPYEGLSDSATDEVESEDSEANRGEASEKQVDSVE